MPDAPSAHPILIIGAGPTGLAAAAKCIANGLDFLLLEAGRAPAWAVRQWRHVRLFSPWHECLDTDAVALLAGTGWTAPDGDAVPTGAALVDKYLAPLAAHPEIRPRLRLGCRATRYARRGVAKHGGEERFAAPFIVTTNQGEFSGRALLDVTGTWRWPRLLPQPMPRGASSRIFQGIPNLSRIRVRERLTGQRILVIGSGHSGMTVVIDLLSRLRRTDGTRILWVRRSPAATTGRPVPAGSARAALEARAEVAARDSRVVPIDGVTITALSHDDRGVTAHGADRAIEADFAIVSTGYRPDLSLGGELWMTVDHRWEAPLGLAELIDPGRHSCNSVPAHGVEALAHPERDFFILGSKSYGRAPNFALTAGYGQLDAVIACLCGREPPTMLPPCDFEQASGQRCG